MCKKDFERCFNDHILLCLFCVGGGESFHLKLDLRTLSTEQKKKRDFLRFPTCQIPNQPWDVDRRGAFGIVDYVKPKGAERIVVKIATISLSMS